MKRVLLVPLVIVAVSLPAQAWADGGAFETNPDDATVTVTNDSPPGVQAGLQPVVGRNPIQCRFTPVYATEENGVVTFKPGTPEVPVLDPVTGEPIGRRMWRDCMDTTTGRLVSAGFVDVLDPVPAPVVAAGVVQQAVALLSPPDGVLRLQPPTELYVRLESWLSIPTTSWRAVSASVSVDPIYNPDGSVAAPGVAATATATPAFVIWDMGDGQQHQCDGPGQAWDPSMPEGSAAPCGYTYLSDSAGRNLAVTATIHYSVSWTWWATDGTSGGCPSGTACVPDILRSDTVFRAVKEVQAVNVEPEGGW